MRRFGGALALIAFLLVPILAVQCYCDDPDLYKKGGFCIDQQVDGRYLCCAPTYTCGSYRCVGYANFSCWAAVATDGNASDAGTQIVKKWTTSSTDISAACQGNAGKPCDINPLPDVGDKNGWDSSDSEPDRGYCDNGTNHCVKCENGVEKYYWTDGPTISAAGNNLCEASCPGVDTLCDEKPKGRFADTIRNDHTVDSCSNCGYYNNTNTCETDYGASPNCDGKSIGYYSGNSGCNSTCIWINCGNYRWNTDASSCKTSCINNGDCYGSAKCVESVCVVDPNAPTIIVYSPEAITYTTSPVTLKFEPNDDHDLSVNCEYVLDGSAAYLGPKATAANHTASISIASQGPHTISVNCTDSSGNEGASNEVTFIFTPSAPSISISAPTEGAYINKNSNITLNFTPQDSFYSSVTCEYVMDSGSPVNMGVVNVTQDKSVSFDVSGEGSHSIYVNCTNPAGKVGQSPIVHFTTDVNTPVVTPISPTNNTTYGSQTILLKFQVTDTVDNSLSCRYVLNSNPTLLGNIVNGSIYSIDVNTGRTGYHTLYIDCVDDTGNTGTSGIINFVVDIVAPVVTIQDPKNITYNSDVISDLPVKFTPVDDFDTNMTCEYKVNDGDPISRGLVANNTQDSSTIDVECNLRKVTVRCTDNYGNLGSSTVYFTINCNHPPTRPGSISPDQSHLLTNLPLTWGPSTDPDNDTIYYYMRMGSACGTWDIFNWTESTGTGYTVPQTLSYGTGSKIYCMELVASDTKPGGLSLSRIENITIFNTQPTATSSAIDQANVGQNITFNMDWSDADGDQVEFFVCKDASCTNCGPSNTSNCFCTISFTGTSPNSCSYTTQQSDNSTVNYWYSMCDNTTAGNKCTGVFAGNDTSFRVNHQPSVPALIPASDTHTTSNLLSWNTASDSDSDSITYDVRVSEIDGGNHTFAQSGISKLNVTATNITIWDTNYYWSARACDEHGFCSDWNATSDIFVRYNNPPDAPSNLTPNATHNTKPLLQWTVNSDPDNDTITTYVCISDIAPGNCNIDGGLKISNNGQYQVGTTLHYDHFGPYYIQLKNTDNTGAGDENSTVYNETLKITNDPPQVANASISPTTAYETSTLICNNGLVSDPENDTINLIYAWYKNGAIMGSQTTSTLGPGNFTKHDNITCRITPSDGIESGTEKYSSNRTISNTLPTKPNNLSPLTTHNLDQRFNFTEGSDDDPTDVVTTRICISDAGYRTTGCNYIAATTDEYFVISNLNHGSESKTYYAVLWSDDAEGISDYYNETFNITNTQPVPISPILPEDYFNTTNQKPFLNWTASSDSPDNDLITYYINISGQVNTSPVNNYTTDTLDDGTYQWSVKACDNTTASNNCTSYTTPRTFTVDTHAPTYTDESITPAGTIYNNDTVTVNTNWTDNSTVVTEVVLQHNATGGDLTNYTTNKSGNMYSYKFPANFITNGAHITWKFIARDIVDNWNTTMPEQTFKVENRPPSISITSQDNKGWGESWKAICNFSDPDWDNLTVRLYSSPDNVTWYLEDTKNCNNCGSPTGLILSAGLDNSYIGESYFRCSAEDPFDVTNSTATVTVQKDDVAVIITQGNGGSVERDTSATITLEVNIYDTDKLEYPVGTLCYINVDEDGSEPYNYTYYNTTDSNGNCTIILDPEKPAYSIGTWYFLGGTDSSNPDYNVSTSSQGSFTITDSFNPTYSEFDSNTTQINNIGESILMWAYWSDNNYLDTLTFSWNLTGSENETKTTTDPDYNHTVPRTIDGSLDEGKTVNFKFYANDTSGNWNETEEKSFTIPNQAPKYSNLWVSQPNDTIIAKGTIISFDAFWTDNFQLDQTWLDNTEGINYTNHQSGWSNYTIDTSLYPAGTTFTATIYANDTVNNVNLTSTFNWTIDGTAPLIDEFQYPDIVHNDDDVITNATVEDMYLDTVWIEGNWTGSWENITVTNITDKVYNYTILKGNLTNQENVWWRYWANDTSGNLAAGEQKNFTVANRLPEVTSINIIPSTAYKNSTLTCENTLFDPDFDGTTPYYMWYRNGTDIGQTTQNLTNAHFNKSDNITCRVTPWDGIQNGTAVNATPVIILNSLPTMPTELEPNKTHDNTPSITWNASSDGDNDRIYYWIKIGNITGGNETLGWTNTGDDTEYTVEKNLTFPAVYYVTIEAKDDEAASGWNQLTINITNFQPDNFTLSSPDDYFNTTNNTPILSWNPSSDGDVNDTITYYAMINSTINSTMETSFITDTLEDGTYLWSVKACDNTTATNNCTDYTSPRTFTVDTHAPIYSNLNMTEGPIHNDMSVQINATWSDPVTGISEVYAWHNATGGWVNETPIQDGPVYHFTIPETQIDNNEVVYWNFWAKDVAGNWNTSMPNQTFIVLNREPTISSITPNLTSPQPAGTVIQFNCAASDEDLDTIYYQFNVSNNGGTDWYTEQDWSTSNLFNWVTDGSDRGTDNRIRCAVRDTTSGDPDNTLDSSDYEIQNNNPIILLAEYEIDKGWGESWSASCTVSDQDWDNLTVRLYSSPDNVTWYLEDTKNCDNCGSPTGLILSASLNNSYIGESYFRCSAEDAFDETNLTDSVTVQKDDVVAVITQGNGGSVDRDSGATITLEVNVYDTDKLEYPAGTPCYIDVTKTGAEPYTTYYNTTDSSGNCTIILDPDNEYTFGTQYFLGGTNSSNPDYNVSTSGQGNFRVTEPQAPTYSEFDSNTTQINNIGESILMWAYWSDNDKLNTLTFSWNLTGLENETQTTTDPNYNYTVPKTIDGSLDEGKTVNFKFYANDTSGNWNETEEKSFTIPNQAPQYSAVWSNPDNDTSVNNGTIISLAALWSDNFQLDQTWLENSYETSSNKTGSFNATSWSNFDIDTATYESGALIATIYANDTVNNVNSTTFTWTIVNTG